MFASSQRSCILLSEELNLLPGHKKCETSTGILEKKKKKVLRAAAPQREH